MHSGRAISLWYFKVAQVPEIFEAGMVVHGSLLNKGDGEDIKKPVLLLCTAVRNTIQNDYNFWRRLWRH